MIVDWRGTMVPAAGYWYRTVSPVARSMSTLKPDSRSLPAAAFTLEPTTLGTAVSTFASSASVYSLGTPSVWSASSSTFCTTGAARRPP